ncbi:hypothetical protein ABFS82_05G005800 [Erythranthe guttata]|uniref:Nodulin-related protein 1 n=1 Tax=Erythranthe guttata TaxID=4155 RepID=A0A022Q415_ERYGU|nr:PREDICTED: uncharacterized protein LOC105974710 [Erythranthe guttata]EYU22384.1 hypothetical protein MIMGU_mgv1a015134mg [Erythranthe guttata]|eukprot:XP_012855301.1 PREDICTED: uncharacterized protein LOC105974710 [Erythranthe guttata]
MDFLANLSKKDEDHKKTKPVSQDPNTTGHNRKPSKSDLIHSAKVVTDAAQSHFRRDPEKYDKGQLAGATADLLSAASDLGKLNDTDGIGKYVDKAEGYLRHYSSSHSPAHPGKTGDHQTTSSGGGGKKPSHGDGGDHYSDGGKKPSHGGEGLGSGDFLKMAGNFLKK